MPTKTLMTANEFETLSARLGPCELVRGEVVEMSPSGHDHSWVTINVAFCLKDWARRSKIGRVLGGEAGVIVETEPDTVRGADVAYISHARLGSSSGGSGFLRVAPELVVEIAGQGQGWRDLIEKAGEYLRMGVDRVWVIDPSSRRLHVLRPDAEPIVLQGEEVVRDDSLLPGFSCRVSDFFND